MRDLDGVANSLRFLMRLLIITTVISAGVKYGGPYLAIPAEPWVAIAMVLTPALVVAIWLGIRQGQATD